MNDYLAMALIDMGKNLPGQLRANRLEKMNAEDKRRQYMSDDLANELSKLQIQSEKNKISTDQTARDRDKAALDALAEATSGMQRQKQFSDLNKLEEQAGIKPADYNIQSSRDIATGTGLTNYGDNEAVKSWMKTNVEDLESNAFKEKNNGNKSLDPDELQFGNRAGLVSWFNKPEKVKETLEQLEYFKDQYNLPENDYEVLKKQAQTGQSYDVRLYMTEKLKGSQKNKLRTELEYDLIGPRTTTKSETTKAGETTDVKLRDEFQSLPEIKTVQNISYNYTKAQKAYDQYLGGKASAYEVDQQLGYFASKALDPNSIVMPGEFDRFAKGLGVIDGAQAMAKKLISGGLKLTDDQRKAMFNIVQNAWETAKEQGLQTYNYYNEQARMNGQTPYNVTGKLDYIFNPKKDMPKPDATSAIDKLKAAAKSGNSKAQAYLKSKGVSW